MKDKKLLPFFDVAYQGLCSGDLEFDAQPVRIFDKDEHELFIAQTFSKNMTLYGNCKNFSFVACPIFKKRHNFIQVKELVI